MSEPTIDAPAINAVASLAKATTDVRVVEVPTAGAKRALVIGKNGTIHHDIEIPHERRINASVNSIAALVAFLDSEEQHTPGEVRVFYDTDIVQATWHDGDRRREATMPLAFTQAFARLQAMCRGGQPMGQKAFWLMLKRDFAGMIDPAIVRQIKTALVNLNKKKASTIGHASQKREEDYEAAIQSAGEEFPEDIKVSVPVYDLEGHRQRLYDVPCTLLADISPDGEAEFTFVPQSLPLSATIDAALEAVIAEVREAAKTNDWTVIAGSPRSITK